MSLPGQGDMGPRGRLRKNSVPVRLPGYVYDPDPDYNLPQEGNSGLPAANGVHVEGDPRFRKKSESMSKENEASLLHFIDFLEPICWNWKLRTFKHFLIRFSKDQEMRIQFTNQWMEEFLDKHEDTLSARIVPFFHTKVRKTLVQPITSEEFYAVVEELYRTLDVLERPESIWNFDSTSVMLPEPPKKNTKKRKNVHDEEERLKEEHTSVMYAVSAAGEHTPATILFKGVRMATEWKCNLEEGDRDRIQLMVNNDGKFDYASTHKWLKTILMRSALPRPLVLFMDSYYSSLENYDFIKQAYDDNIHLVSIPPRIATLKLPLGLTVMGVLKDKWYEELDELQLAATASNPLTRAQIVNALLPADTDALQEENIKLGFAQCGLFAFNPAARPVESRESSIEVEPQPEIMHLQPLSPVTQEAVNEALELFARAGVSEQKAKKLLRNMNVPGFVPAAS